MHPALARTDHRPWPIPEHAWTWRQSWIDLLFAHWPIGPDALRPLVAKGLEIDTFDGAAWVGVVPFRMEGVMRRPLPDLPWVSAFPELNVRTYVKHHGKPGVWFLSLDATNPLAVWPRRSGFTSPTTKRGCVLIEEESGSTTIQSEAGVTLGFVDGTNQPAPPSSPSRTRSNTGSPNATACLRETSEAN